MIVIVIIIIIILLYIIISYTTSPPPSFHTPVTADLAPKLADMADNVCRVACYNLPEYGVRITTTGNSYTTFADNQHPIVNLRAYYDNKLYDDDTLKLAFLHEIAHILCPDHHHDSYFTHVQQQLVNAAISLYYLSPNSVVDADYPCQGP